MAFGSRSSSTRGTNHPGFLPDSFFRVWTRRRIRWLGPKKRRWFSARQAAPRRASGTTPGTQRLINVSARAQVGTGSGVLIVGFVVGGTTSKTVLVRASGPLSQFGLTGVLPDPDLVLNGPDGVIASNEGGGGNAQVASTAASVGAFSWPNASSHDSALLLTLPPGAYTAVVSGASADTGVALVEVYDVP